MTNEILMLLIKCLGGIVMLLISSVVGVVIYIWHKKDMRDDKLFEEGKDKDREQDSHLSDLVQSTRDMVGQITVLNKNNTEILRTQVEHKKILTEVVKTGANTVSLFIGLQAIVERHGMDIEELKRIVSKAA